MGSRSLEKAATAITSIQSETPSSPCTIVPVQIDIEDDASIAAAFEFVKSTYGRVDALVNNAGAAFDPELQHSCAPATLRSVWTRTYALNVTSTHVFTSTFAPLLVLSQTPRLLFITSGLSSLTTCAAGLGAKAAPSMAAYRCSKTALNMLMLDWKRVLAPEGVRVFGISPGFLATGLGGLGKEYLARVGAGDASGGGGIIADVVHGKRDGEEGVVITREGTQAW